MLLWWLVEIGNDDETGKDDDVDDVVDDVDDSRGTNKNNGGGGGDWLVRADGEGRKAVAVMVGWFVGSLVRCWFCWLLVGWFVV